MPIMVAACLGIVMLHILCGMQLQVLGSTVATILCTSFPSKAKAWIVATSNRRKVKTPKTPFILVGRRQTTEAQETRLVSSLASVTSKHYWVSFVCWSPFVVFPTKIGTQQGVEYADNVQHLTLFEKPNFVSFIKPSHYQCF